MKMIFLVDGDNNISTGLQGIDLLSEEDTVMVFYGKGQPLSGVQKLCAGTRARVQYLESVRGGKNAIDFQIITELGVLVGRGEADFAYVISQDKGYEAAMSALRTRYADTFREVALRPSIQACVQAAFLLRSASREELAAALMKKCGEVQGLCQSGEAVCPAASAACGGAPEGPAPAAKACRPKGRFQGGCRDCCPRPGKEACREAGGEKGGESPGASGGDFCGSAGTQDGGKACRKDSAAPPGRTPPEKTRRGETSGVKNTRTLILGPGFVFRVSAEKWYR